MQIVTILNSHGNTELTSDTIDSIRTWVGRDVLVVVDGGAWDWGKDVQLEAHKINGFFHRCGKSPYRNITLGLMKAHEHWPEADWYLYTEYDVLFASSEFKSDLRHLPPTVYSAGNDLRTLKEDVPLLDKIVGTQVKDHRYLLGCCVFHRGEFIRKLHKSKFFDKFLFYTNCFSQGFFPGYSEYDFGECLYPTLAHHLGGQLHELACWGEGLKWRGNYHRYQLRWMPEIKEQHPLASIIHPVKDVNNKIRIEHKTKRDVILCRNLSPTSQ